MAKTSNRDARRLIMRWAKIAQRSGWTVTSTGGGHLRFTPPNGRPIFTASSPSDGRGTSNTRSLLRKAGLDI